MRNFVDWFREQTFDTHKPWLILGKGPSLDYKDQHDLDNFTVVGLNHVPCALPVDFAHVIDIEVLLTAGESIEKNSKFLIMPAVPHEHMKARNDMTLQDWVERIPVIKKFSDEDRLLWYDISTAEKPMSHHPRVSVFYFSSEAVLGLLGLCGVRQIRSLGIDGGVTYSSAFKGIESESCLKNGQQSFDLQFKHFPEIINRFDLDYSSLADEAPMQIFIGSSPSEWLPSKVLEYSIKKHASFNVKCHRLYEKTRSYKLPKDKANQPRTPFSFQRFLIPELMNYNGRAVYLDSDMLVMQDIARLWRMPFGGADIICTSALSPAQKAVQFSVMLMNCSALGWNIDALVDDLDAGKLSYESLVYRMDGIAKTAPRIPPTWNFLDRFVDGTTALIHYTNMHTQPWVARDNAAASVWFQHLREALIAGFITIDQIQEQIKAGYVRPSLLVQIQEDIANPALLPGEAVALDDEFVPVKAGQHDHLPVVVGKNEGKENSGAAVSRMMLK